MSNNNLSLDDIIKQSKLTMRGRGGSYRGVNRTFLKTQNRVINKSNRGHVRTNVSTRGRGGKIVTDARMKIIEKNRLKLTDARDKLAEKAKLSDARLKLDKLRASSQFKKDIPISGISRKTGKNGRITLTTNNGNLPAARAAIRPFHPHIQNMVYTAPVIPNESHYATTMNFLEPQTLRRTVNNEYAPTPPPPPPVFNFKPVPTYSWKRQNHGDLAEDWNFMAKMRSHRDIGVKSRLETVTIKTGMVGESGRPKTSSASSQTNGYRIIVSNLQPNVTQEDIKELFEDVGDLLVSRLVRPGTAEVIYKTLKDAMKAVETYHNRQLDGHPMKCLLVNPRSKNNPGPGIRTLNE